MSGPTVIFEKDKRSAAQKFLLVWARCLLPVDLPVGISVSRPMEDSMNLTALIIQLIAGALGGNAAGSVSKDGTLGPMGNSIAGAIGGGLGGQVLSALLGLGGTAAASGMDVGSIVSAFLTGGVSGGLTALVVGFLKAKLAS